MAITSCSTLSSLSPLLFSWQAVGQAELSVFVSALLCNELGLVVFRFSSWRQGFESPWGWLLTTVVNNALLLSV